RQRLGDQTAPEDRRSSIFWPYLLVLLLQFLPLCLLSLTASCVKPPRFKFARIEPGFAKAYYAAKSKVNYVCRPGYERILGTTPVVTCRENYTWTEIPDFCKGQFLIVAISFKTTLSNGALLFSFRYRLMGYPSIQCALNETEVEWQPKPPKCQQITCSPPPNISHSSHDGESIRIFAYNSTVTYKCDHGFSLMGDASIRCATEDKISGVWEGSKPECKDVRCNRPQIPNGRVASTFQSTYLYDNIIRIECDPHHTLQGSDFIKCGADSKWKPDVPTCVKSKYSNGLKCFLNLFTLRCVICLFPLNFEFDGFLCRVRTNMENLVVALQIPSTLSK
uniref:Sushi domain-containing protein n=1 Tax=Varanus komodoensis TaxID=61221 RepID=A0A8D2KYK0_VARKO